MIPNVLPIAPNLNPVNLWLGRVYFELIMWAHAYFNMDLRLQNVADLIHSKNFISFYAIMFLLLYNKQTIKFESIVGVQIMVNTFPSNVTEARKLIS